MYSNFHIEFKIYKVTYPHNFEQKIGFNKIRNFISERCLSPLGLSHLENMQFSTNYDQINKNLLLTDEFIKIIENEDEFPINNFYDVRIAISRIKVIGSYLDQTELFDLRRSLDTINQIVRFFINNNDEEIKYPHLTELSQNVSVFPDLVYDIDKILDKFGRIKDNASPELMQIRRDLTATVNSISRNLNAILKSAQAEGYVDKDVSPTLRDGRLVIPVAPTFKRKIKGIVHDESASGKTVFIEPSQVVEANNKVRELENEERREIIRLLTNFTDKVRPYISEILDSYIYLGNIDFIRAKAHFSKSINAILPIFEDKQQAIWNHAIHPLLYISHKAQNKPVVPLDIDIDQDQRIVLISGPNAG